jgi:hypothetical protein
MNGRMQGAVGVTTLAPDAASGLAATGSAGEDHVAPLAASNTARLLGQQPSRIHGSNSSHEPKASISLSCVRPP